MAKRLVIERVSLSLAACFLAVCVYASRSLADTLGRYPGSMQRVGYQSRVIRFEQSGLAHQVAYQSPDELASVLRWYAWRLQIAPVWDLGQGAGCAWFARTESAVLISHNVSVQLCATPGGTRILLNETLNFGP
jgi:hypothetical protein